MADRVGFDESSPYWLAFKSWVCAACLDCRDDGECGLPPSRVCALKRHLPVIVETAHRTHSRQMDEYLAAIQTDVCARCPQQDAGGHCTLRDHVECALYAYLPLVLDAVDEVDRGTAAAAP